MTDSEEPDERNTNNANVTQVDAGKTVSEFKAMNDTKHEDIAHKIGVVSCQICVRFYPKNEYPLSVNVEI